MKTILQALITDYREDDDATDLVDWIQGTWVRDRLSFLLFLSMCADCFFSQTSAVRFQLQCCGITSPNDWNNNGYFNCSNVESSEACGVPYSCCRPPKVRVTFCESLGSLSGKKKGFSSLIEQRFDFVRLLIRIQSIDWLIDWLMDCFIDVSIDWLIDLCF